MKKLTFTFLLACTFFLGKAQIDTAFYVNDLLGRGINGYYSYLYYDGDFDWIAWDSVVEAGFNSVRLVFISSSSLSDITTATLDSMQAAVDTALAYGILPIIDYHLGPAWFTTNYNSTQHDYFCSNWGAIANRFSSYDWDEVVYELCNEPTESAVLTDYNGLAADAIDSIRAYDEHKCVIVPVSYYGSMRGVTDLEFPDDNKLIMGIHYYLSGWVQTQNCPWEDTPGCGCGPFYGIPYAGAIWYNIDAMVDNLELDFRPLWDWWETYDTVPVTIDEWGTLFYTDSVNRYNYANYLTRWFDEQGFSHMVWDFAGHFGIYNDSDREVNYDAGPDRYIHNLDSAIVMDDCPIYDYDIIDTLVAYDTTTTGWSTYSNGGGGVSISIVDYELRANVYSTDYTYINARVWSPYFTFEEDHVYRITYKIHTSASKDWAWKLMDDGEGHEYSWYYVRESGTETETFAHTIIHPMTDDYTRFEFLLGGSTGYFYIEDFFVEELDPDMETVLYTLYADSAASPPETVDDTVWYDLSDTLFKAALDTSIACSDSAVIFESLIEGGGGGEWELVDTAAINFSGGASVSNWTDVDYNDSETLAPGWGITTTGSNNGTSGEWPGPYPDAVCWWYIYEASASAPITITITGLDNDNEYDFDILLSRDGIAERMNEVTVGGGTPQQIDVADNTTVLYFTDVSPTSGSITITIDVYDGASYCYINAMIIREYEEGEGEGTYNQDQAYTVHDSINFGTVGIDSIRIVIEFGQVADSVSAYLTLDSLDGDTIATILSLGTSCYNQGIILNDTVYGYHNLYTTIDSLDTYVYLALLTSEPPDSSDPPSNDFMCFPNNTLIFKDEKYWGLPLDY